MIQHLRSIGDSLIQGAVLLRHRADPRAHDLAHEAANVANIALLLLGCRSSAAWEDRASRALERAEAIDAKIREYLGDHPAVDVDGRTEALTEGTTDRPLPAPTTTSPNRSPR